jgi:uncharacterized protein (TIGR02284 family)
MADPSEVDVMNSLIETCRDGERGFRAAADMANDPDIKALLAALADERGGFAEQLAPHVHRLGGHAHTNGTTAGAMHRRWMTFKGTVSNHHDAALLQEAERGERNAIQSYRDALQGMLPPTVSDLIERQLIAILEARSRLAALGSDRMPVVQGRSHPLV